jgi:predicted nucleic acid-binding protein
VDFLVDSNILLRHVEPKHPMHPEAVNAVAALLNAGESVYVLPQNISEFLNFCTRHLNKNGLSFTPAHTDTEVKRIESLLTMQLDNAAIYSEWRQLVVNHAVSAVQVHDARIVAAMKAHGITHLVTFNHVDFNRYTGITVMSPQDVISAYPPQSTP